MRGLKLICPLCKFGAWVLVCAILELIFFNEINKYTLPFGRCSALDEMRSAVNCNAVCAQLCIPLMTRTHGTVTAECVSTTHMCSNTWYTGDNTRACAGTSYSRFRLDWSNFVRKFRLFWRFLYLLHQSICNVQIWHIRYMWIEYKLSYIYMPNNY